MNRQSTSTAATHAHNCALLHSQSLQRAHPRRWSPSYCPNHRACLLQTRLHSNVYGRRGTQRARVVELETHSVDVCSAPAIDKVECEAGLYTIYGSLHTELSEKAVLDVLTDYEGLARIYNNIEASQLLQSGSQKQVLQTCRWEFLVFSGTFETRLTVHEARQHGEVVFSLNSSSFMRQFQGAWKVSAVPGGGCRVQHCLSVAPSLAPPEALAVYTKKIFVRQVERLLEDLARELCRVQEGSRAAQDGNSDSWG